MACLPAIACPTRRSRGRLPRGRPSRVVGVVGKLRIIHHRVIKILGLRRVEYDLIDWLKASPSTRHLN